MLLGEKLTKIFSETLSLNSRAFKTVSKKLKKDNLKMNLNKSSKPIGELKKLIFSTSQITMLRMGQGIQE